MCNEVPDSGCGNPDENFPDPESESYPVSGDETGEAEDSSE